MFDGIHHDSHNINKHYGVPTVTAVDTHGADVLERRADYGTGYIA